MSKIQAQISAKGLIGSLILMLIFVLPVLSWAGHKDKIYVDAATSGKEDGSSDHPFKKISSALKKTGKKDEVHIRPGTYKENIEIPEGVDVFGSGKSSVIIKAKDSGQPVVSMKNKTSIDNVTIMDGRYGIKVGTNDKVSITKCLIKNNSRDGISIKTGAIEEKRKVTISKSEIRNNGKAGIYAEKRRLVIVDSEINDNHSDGIDLQSGSRAWVAGNRIKSNSGSGLKAILDGSEIWTKNNTIRDNKREGMEINSYGGKGRMDINKSKFYQNKRYAAARILRGNAQTGILGGLTFQNNNIFSENTIGNISPAIRIK